MPRRRPAPAPPEPPIRRPERDTIRALVARITAAGDAYNWDPITRTGSGGLRPQYQKLEALLDVPGEPHQKLLMLRLGPPIEDVEEFTDDLLADFDERNQRRQEAGDSTAG